MQGLLVTLAIGLHNIPEGLAVATVLVGKGISAKRAFWWTLFTAGRPAGSVREMQHRLYGGCAQ